MDAFLAQIALAVAVFASTDVDDIVVLIAFFADPKFRSWQVVLGQFLGIGALCAVSLAGSFAVLVVPLPFIGLLGFAPIAIGVKKLRELRRGEFDPVEPLGHGGGKILAVTLVTMANGGDNISVYTPLFASRTAVDIAVFIAVFMAMTGVWCAGTYWVARHPRIGAPIRRSGHRFVPLVLIALGVLILVELGSYRLLTGYG